MMCRREKVKSNTQNSMMMCFPPCAHSPVFSCVYMYYAYVFGYSDTQLFVFTLACVYVYVHWCLLSMVLLVSMSTCSYMYYILVTISMVTHFSLPHAT